MNVIIKLYIQGEMSRYAQVEGEGERGQGPYIEEDTVEDDLRQLIEGISHFHYSSVVCCLWTMDEE